ncbi:MAG: hypothetical protein OJF59_000327 [Cytophagales bacterium]|nr:MAG: hypothetical protein OJF59_000327 [Cytophagales bacterium]
MSLINTTGSWPVRQSIELLQCDCATKVLIILSLIHDFKIKIGPEDQKIKTKMLNALDLFFYSL